MREWWKLIWAVHTEGKEKSIGKPTDFISNIHSFAKPWQNMWIEQVLFASLRVDVVLRSNFPAA